MARKKEPIEAKKVRTAEIIRLLKKAYPDAHTSLNHTNPLELLIATMLSAQSTDATVNIVTADLFRKYRSCADYLAAPRSELEKNIHATGFFRNKAKAIHGACAAIVDKFGGEVPNNMEDMVSLPGVGRKTANVVLGNAFGIAAGVVVDTHVARMSQRLELTQQKQPEKIEKDLMELVPTRDWILFPHLLIYHGRRICIARKPKCAECVVESLCPASLLKDSAKPTRKAAARPTRKAAARPTRKAAAKRAGKKKAAS
jgi:endonuclease-3